MNRNDIQRTFDHFFKEKDGENRSPYSFKKYHRSIYNVLCKEYKWKDWKIDRDMILEEFASEENKELFWRTKQYNKPWIKNEFNSFFEYLNKLWKKYRSVNDLNNRNESFCVILQRNNRDITNPQQINRENIIKELDLDNNKYWILFTRRAPKRVPITMEKINIYIADLIYEKKYTHRSPKILFIRKPSYYARLRKNFRTSDNKIDRLYILYKEINDLTLVKHFNHRYSIHLWLKEPKSTTTKKEVMRDRIIINHEKNPEEILIEKEKQGNRRNTISNLIKKLTPTEQKVIYSFLEEEEYNNDEFTKIIEKLRNLTTQ